MACVQELERENQRELLLAMSAEWRVVLVKLADRLHNMRTLQHMPQHKQAKKAKETLELFVPLARRLGAAQVEDELQSLSNQYLFPRAATLLKPELLTPLARMRCEDKLDGFLHDDEALAESDVDWRLSCHRARWAAHCERLKGDDDADEPDA
jgi:(p)ppGpp synthase/HD superfamily hydrolase